MSFKPGNVIMIVSLVVMLLSFVKAQLHSSEAVTANMTGQWSIEAQRDGRLRLRVLRGDKERNRASYSIHLALAQFQGLTHEQVFGSSSSVDFHLVREAGTLSFSGSFHEGTGAGHWTFNASPAFISLLGKYGYEQPTDQELYALYTNDVGSDYIAGLRSAGYTGLAPTQLVALRSNDVTLAYIKSLQDAGYKGLTTAQLIALRTNGVTRDFIERLERRGQKNLTPERLLSLRINAGTPD
jgi:hypothetical protein